MGFWNKVFGREGSPPPEREAPRRRGGRGEAFGAPVTDMETSQGPFPKRIRLRAVYADYGLTGSWQVVTLNSAEDWPAAREEVLRGYYQRYGLIRLPGGGTAIRWNEGTWRGVRDALEVVYDPSFAQQGGQAGSPSA